MYTPLFLAFLFFLPTINALRALLKSSNYTGTGCPPNTAVTTLSLDSSKLDNSVDHFPLYVGPGTKVSDHTASCTFLFDIAFDEPCTWLYVNPFGMDLIGYARLDESVKLKVISTYEWVGQNNQASNTFNIPTPINGRFWQHSGNETDNVVKSPCDGGTLKVTYRASASRTSQGPVGEFPWDPEPGEETWRFSTSLQIGKCGTCNKA